MITLNADEHRQWETAVTTWPTCQTCGGDAFTEDFKRRPTYEICPDCVAGRVPQPVYIVIEGEPAQLKDSDGTMLSGFIPDARWRVPVGEPCEIRARCTMPLTTHDGPWHVDCCDGGGSVLLASAATVEVLPVIDMASFPTSYPCVTVNTLANTPDVLLELSNDDARTLTLDPLPVPGRHFVAVVEVQP